MSLCLLFKFQECVHRCSALRNGSAGALLLTIIESVWVQSWEIGRGSSKSREMSMQGGS